LTPGDEFAPIGGVKHVLPALVAVVFTLTACKTTADRFDLYQPSRAEGPATARLRDWTLFGRYNHQSTTYTVPVTEAAAPPPPSENAPLPPLPAPGATDQNTGLPSATPLPAAVPSITAPANTAPNPAPAITAPAATPPADNSQPPPDAGSSPAPSRPGLSQ
jgi:hypothetical protein